MPLGEIWRKTKAGLLRRRWAVLAAALVPLVGAATVQMLRPGVYQASASVFVDPQLSKPGSAGSVPEQAIVASQIRLATSRTVLQNAIAREKLTEDTTFMAPPTGLMALAANLLKAAGFGSSSFNEDRPAAVLRLVSGSVVARAGEGANLIDIAATSEVPGATARMANAVAQAFVDELVASADAVLGSERGRLTKRGDDLKARLKDAETKLSIFRQQNGLDLLQRAGTGEIDLVGQLPRARLATADAKTKYEQIQKLMASGKEPEVIADLLRLPSLERLKVQYNEAAAQEVSFRSSLGPKHPAYLESLQQAREKKRLLQEGLRLAVTASRIDWQSAREQEMALEKRAGSEPVPQAPPSQPPMQLRELERDVETARAAYERYVRSLDLPEAGTPAVVARVVVAAATPVAPVTEGRGAVWGLAFSISALLAALLAISGMKQEFSRPLQPARAPSAPLSGVKPPVRKPSEPKAAPAPQAQTVRVVRPAPPPPPSALTSLAALADDFSGKADEFALQTVLVTSSGDDKSRVALELARLARSRELRVLLIDADEEHATLTAAHGHGAVTGSVAINGRLRPLVLLESAGRHQICLIPVEGRLHAVEATPAVRSLSGIAGNFDLVIIDGPRLAGTLTERKLARAAQVVVLVQEEGAGQSVASVAHNLGVTLEAVRMVLPIAEETSQGTEQKPMGVIRLKKVA